MLIVKAFSILHLPYWIHNRFRLPTSDYVGMFYHEKARERVLNGASSKTNFLKFFGIWDKKIVNIFNSLGHF